MNKIFRIFVFLAIIGLSTYVNAQRGKTIRTLESPKIAEDENNEPLGLPKNSTLIRANIVDTFSCDGKPYGYYADVDNDCQIFHVCQPTTFDDGKVKVYKWSFICPIDTIFNQEHFQCARTEIANPCSTAPSFYSLNDEFGKIPVKKVYKED